MRPTRHGRQMDTPALISLNQQPLSTVDSLPENLSYNQGRNADSAAYRDVH
jgi:hypothetical protein